MAEKHEAIVQDTETTANLEIGKIEEDLKANNPIEATKRAKLFIRDAVAKAKEKITKDGDLPKDQTKFYLDRLEKVQKDAMDKIDADMERYQNIYNFEAKRAATLVRLEKNEMVFAQQAEGTNQVRLLHVLKDVAEGWKKEQALIGPMAAPDREDEKREMLSKIDDQVKKIEGEQQKVRDFHLAQIQQFDGTVESMEAYRAKWEDSESKPLEPRVFSAATVREAWQQVFYLKRLQADLAGSDETELLEAVNSRVAKLEPLVIYCERYSLDDSIPERRSRWAQYKKLEQNLLAAQKKVAQLEAQVPPPRAELAQARSWLAGAQQSVDKQLGELTRSVTMAQMKEGDEAEIPLYSVRTGTTKVEPRISLGEPVIVEPRITLGEPIIEESPKEESPKEEGPSEPSAEKPEKPKPRVKPASTDRVASARSKQAKPRNKNI